MSAIFKGRKCKPHCFGSGEPVSAGAVGAGRRHVAARLGGGRREDHGNRGPADHRHPTHSCGSEGRGEIGIQAVYPGPTRMNYQAPDETLWAAICARASRSDRPRAGTSTSNGWKITSSAA